MATTERKRHREESNDGTPRRSKKSKDDVAASVPLHSADGESALEIRKKHKEKRKHRAYDEDNNEDAKVRKDKKDKKEKRDKKSKAGKASSRKQQTVATSEARVSAGATSSSPAKVTFPFFTQTVSLWVPLYPVGFDRPITSVAQQHIAGLVNHYSPLLGGYLLAYRSVNLADTSVRADPRNPPTDATPATLASVDEYAVGFGWMTADVDLFVPSRGAWLEGTVVLQNEGAIGVNCWEKFNASIEAARLPKGWKFVDLTDGTGSAVAAANGSWPKANAQSSGAGEEDSTPSDEEGDQQDEEQLEHDPLTTESDMHTGGYWADENGVPVSGKILFRIKEFDVGLAGDNGYLAIEGTMLSEADEGMLLLRERERNRARASRGGKFVRRPLPEFSITQFGKEEEEEDSGQRVEVYKGSRPGTPDD